MTTHRSGRSWPGITTGVILPATLVILLVGCGGSAAATSSPTTAPADQASASAPSDGGGAASPTSDAGGGGAEASAGGGPVGGDIGDRSKGSIQATISGGYSASVDLPFGAPLAQLLSQGPGTAYLPFTDVTNGTLFLTINEGNQLIVQYAGPDNVGMTNGASPCDLKLDALDSGQAKGSFTCKGMLVVRNDGMGSADMTGTFEAHR
jgi:hypothetical protein